MCSTQGTISNDLEWLSEMFSLHKALHSLSATAELLVCLICCSARCVITDLEEFVPLMQLNIDANRHLLTGSIRAEALHWGTPTSGRFAFPDYILLADCIYYEAVRVSLL